MRLASDGASFEPVCEESEACKSTWNATQVPAGTCKCSGEWDDLVEVIDHVRIPASINPGKYVLGWRW